MLFCEEELLLRIVGRWIARSLLREYQLYWIVGCRRGPQDIVKDHSEASEVSLGAVEIQASSVPEIRATGKFAGQDARGFCLKESGEVVAVCWFWWGERYRARNFWALGKDEAKLVQVVVAERARGRGLAPRLLRSAAYMMHADGYSQLFARVWHSNHSSLRAFEKAGWDRVAFVATLGFRGFRSPVRIQVPWYRLGTGRR